MATKKSDTFANVAAVLVIESAAGTATYNKFAFPFSIMDKMALIISRIEYHLADLAALNSSGDYCVVALTVSNTVVDIGAQNDPLIVDNMTYHRVDYGTAATGQVYTKPVIKDFANLPGGGILVAPAPLYAGIQSNGAGSATRAWLKLYYTYTELAADEYWQLVESRRIISS